MRLMTWNCRVGGFRKKAAHVAPLEPDVVVVPETESLVREMFLDGARQPTFRDRVGLPGTSRGIGVFSYTGVELARAADEGAPLHGFARYVARRGDLAFQVVGVWTSDTGAKETAYRQAHEGLRRSRDWILGAPTVVLGDFNISAAYRGGAAWRDLLALTEPLGLVSAYHRFFDEPPGRETRATYLHRGDEEAKWHIDYCFVPSAWAARLRAVEVAGGDTWCEASDHRPLIVDVDV